MCILYNIPKNATDKYELCPLTSARLNNPYLVTGQAITGDHRRPRELVVQIT